MGDAGRARHSYHRLHANAAGSGATETLWHLLSRLRSTGVTHLSGHVHGVFDRTLYVSLPVPATGSQQALLAFGTASVRPGPLMIHLETPSQFSFQRLGCSQGTACALRLTGRESDVQRVSFQFRSGGTIDVDVDVLHLLPAPADAPPAFSVDAFGPDTPAVSRQRRLLRWHRRRGATGGIPWLCRLDADSLGASDPELDGIVQSLVDVLVPNTALSDGPPDHRTDTRVRPDEIRPLVELLGRGPGATPSGDDVLVGILLVLLGIAEPRLKHRVRSLGRTLRTAAADRTTAISRALLTQACLRRAAAPALACLHACTTPDSDQQRLRAASLELLETGHTSGVDTLAGMLTATTTVLPRLSERLDTDESHS